MTGVRAGKSTRDRLETSLDFGKIEDQSMDVTAEIKKKCLARFNDPVG